MTELEEHVFAYFLSTEALHISIDGRFYRREEFVKVFEDRIFYATQRLGPSASGRHSKIMSRRTRLLKRRVYLPVTIDCRVHTIRWMTVSIEQ